MLRDIFSCIIVVIIQYIGIWPFCGNVPAICPACFHFSDLYCFKFALFPFFRRMEICGCSFILVSVSIMSGKRFISLHFTFLLLLGFGWCLPLE